MNINGIYVLEIGQKDNTMKENSNVMTPFLKKKQNCYNYKLGLKSNKLQERRNKHGKVHVS